MEVCSETGIGAIAVVMIILKPSLMGDPNSIMTIPYHTASTYGLFLSVGFYYGSRTVKLQGQFLDSGLSNFAIED